MEIVIDINIILTFSLINFNQIKRQQSSIHFNINLSVNA